jgi:hypothetical protein
MTNNEVLKTKEETFKFWESDLRYRIKEEEKKYHNEWSPVDWVEMVICKSLKDIIKETNELIDRAREDCLKEVIEKIEVYFGHILNDDLTGKPMNITPKEILDDLKSQLKEQGEVDE